MDKLKEMEAFVTAVESGSLAKAALALGVTAAMLGRRIDALEQRLGVKLLHRSTRHLGLTEQGSAFLEQCKKLLSDLETAEELMSAGRHMATGHLRVTAPAGFGRKHVAPHGPAFLAANAQVQISFDLTDRVVDLVREGYDMGIRIGSVLDPNLWRSSCGATSVWCALRPPTSNGTVSRARWRISSSTTASPSIRRADSSVAGISGTRASWSPFACEETSTATTGNCCIAGPRRAAAWLGAPPGRFRRSSRAERWSQCWTSTHWWTTTSGPCIRSSRTFRPRSGSLSST